MEKQRIIRLKVDVQKNSVLDKAMDLFIKKRAELRKKRQEFYKKTVDKQLKKIEGSGL